MVRVVLTPGAVAAELISQIRPVTDNSTVYSAPGGLYPLQSSAWEMDEYRIMAGWPTSVPRFDIRANSMVSAVGDVITSRDDPTAIVTGALLRWVADDLYYDQTALRWNPIQGDSPTWDTSVGYAPTIVHDYEYRVGSERFYMTALNFDSDTRNHMWANFSKIIGGAAGYTVIMVMSPNSAYGNNLSVPYNGLWCPGRATPTGNTFAESVDPNWMSVTIQGNYLYLESESLSRTKVVSVANQLANNAPSFVALSFARPETTLYVGNGPGSIQSRTAHAGQTPVALDYGILLGRSNGDVLHTADMALFDLGIYANVLTDAEVRDEFALLSRSYGGDK